MAALEQRIQGFRAWDPRVLNLKALKLRCRRAGLRWPPWSSGFKALGL